MASDAPASATAEFRRYWPLVLASMAGNSLTALPFYTMGLFVEPVEAEFGWSRGFVTAGLTVYAFIGVTLAGPMGYLIGRVGPRRVGLPGTFFFCAALALLATVTGSKFNWLLMWGIVALTAVTVKPTVWTTAIVSRFEHGRGIALALSLCGAGLSTMAGPILINHMIEAYGWRAAYVGVGAIWLAVCIPLIYFFFYGAQDRRRGQPPADIEARGAGEGTNGDLPLGAMLRSRAFLKIGLTSFLLVVTTMGITVHLVPMFSASGLERARAAEIAGLMGAAAFLGRMATGSLFDRLSPTLVGTVICLLPATAFGLLLMFDGSIPFALVIAIIIGLCSGAEMEMAAYLSSRFLGRASFSTLFGVIVGLVTLGAGLGPTLTGMIYDGTGSYRIALLIALPLALISAALTLSLGKPPASRR
ncbi:MFS transporter [Rhizorhabdus dicambivorans]|nr:MFS transporter [Rhizorhabdus dicambivorans]